MSGFRLNGLAAIFVLLAVVCAIALVALAGGYWSVDNELPGLVLGAVLLAVILFVVRS